MLDYNNCSLCPRNCRVNRNEKKGYCLVSNEVYISAYLKHFGEEPPISGDCGSGTVFFSGCSLRCVFCQNYQISWLLEGNKYSINSLADIFLDLQNQGAHNINLVTPTHYAISIIAALEIAKTNGLRIPIVYNSSGFDAIETLEMIDSFIDVYLPDFKFIDAQLSKKYCNSEEYPEIAKQNILFMIKRKGQLKLRNGLAERGVLIRHLVMPNAIENSKRILKFIAEECGVETFMSIMSQYSPVYKAVDFTEINCSISKKEYDELLDYAIALNLDNAFFQELVSQNIYFPDFKNQETPFKQN